MLFQSSLSRSFLTPFGHIYIKTRLLFNLQKPYYLANLVPWNYDIFPADIRTTYIHTTHFHKAISPLYISYTWYDINTEGRISSHKRIFIYIYLFYVLFAHMCDKIYTRIYAVIRRRQLRRLRPTVYIVEYQFALSQCDGEMLYDPQNNITFLYRSIPAILLKYMCRWLLVWWKYICIYGLWLNDGRWRSTFYPKTHPT